MSSLSLTRGTALTPAITSWNSLASDITAGLLVGCSAAINNASEKAIAYEVSTLINYSTSAPTDATVYLYVAEYDGAAWTDDGYGDAPNGTDQTVLIGSPPIHRGLTSMSVVQSQVSRKRVVYWDPAEQFSILLHNGSGQALAASGHGLRITPLHYEYV